MRYAVVAVLVILVFSFTGRTEESVPAAGQPRNEAVDLPSGLAPEPAQAAPQKRAGAPRTYKVWLWQESRDCLWNLAKKYYGDPWMWKKIYLANKDQIEDPRVIYPKQILVIPPSDELE